LETTAQDRQVIVFTHDDRLFEAVRRLAIPAHVFEVTRRPGSVVEVRPALDPVARVIDDAMALAQTRELPPAAAARVVPGLCRTALEAACTEVVRRRRLTRGETHVDVEKLLEDADRLALQLALALFDDPSKGGDVPPTLERRFGRSAVEVYRRANRGAHAG